MSTLVTRIDEIIRPALAAKDIDVVQIKIVDSNQRKTIQILADNLVTGRITLDECAQASRTISALLDVDDVVPGAYNLEVSSPGIDRPLVKMADYEKYQGFEAKLETALPVGGRSRFRGVLKAPESEQVSIQVDGTLYQIPLGNISQAKLVLTDALIKAHQKGGASAPKEQPNTEPNIDA